MVVGGLVVVEEVTCKVSGTYKSRKVLNALVDLVVVEAGEEAYLGIEAEVVEVRLIVECDNESRSL